MAEDRRRAAETYRVRRGEQGVLTCEPWKSEILPHWRFRTPDLAEDSARQIYALFLDYKARGDFPGMDMARKFLQMGYTRSRRYANHRSGRKYQGPVPAACKGRSGAHGRPVLPRRPDPVKAECARRFYVWWRKAAADPEYEASRKAWKARHG